MREQVQTRSKIHAVQVILAALFFMLFGTSLELILLGHYEDPQQLIPLVLIGISLFTLFFLFITPNHFLKTIFKLTLCLTALSGIYGTYLHLYANYEFELEMKPTETSWNLFIESLSGALPALAPCSMIVLALLGYSYLLLLKHKK